jgi:hypothetical protein
MSLTDKKAIKELRAILKKDYGGRDVSEEEAAELGEDLLKITAVVLKAKLRTKMDQNKT